MGEDAASPPSFAIRGGKHMRNRVLALASIMAFVTLACSTGGPDNANPSGGSTGPVTITLWHGQTETAKKTMDTLVAKFNQTHTDVQVDSSSGGVTTDQMLEKVLTSIAAGTYPDIAYLYGSWAANIATSPKIADLTQVVTDPAVNWDDFWPAGRETATVNGKVIGFPAIIDNLSVIYNKDLFDAAGLDYPSSDWTWQDFRDTAKALRDPAKNIYGVNYPVTGDEDTVWRFWPFLWQAGGEALNEDNTEATFNQQPGVDALTLWQQMAVEDGSVFLDPTDEKAEPLFTGGHLGMFVSGPWEVPVLQENHMNWGDQVMPSFDGSTHETISGPDIWAVFNQNDARVAGAVEFLTWFSAPEQQLEWIAGAGSLPIRQSISTDPGYQDYLDAYPGIDAMVANLANAVHTRPAVTQYPMISEAMGQSISAVLLGETSPQDALNQAAEQTNALLAVPSG
jgi:multiple sugar transport system substrate-binding protein